MNKIVNIRQLRVFNRGAVTLMRGLSAKQSSTDGSGNANMIDSDYAFEMIPPKMNQRGPETIDIKKARLLYQSRKRGMLENGLLLGTFAAKYLESFDKKQVELYDKLINEPSNDWDIFYWATGIRDTPPQYDNEIMKMLKQHVQNEEKETRYRQPDLN